MSEGFFDSRRSSLRLGVLLVGLLVFAAEAGKVSLRRDPDGHVILLDGR